MHDGGERPTTAGCRVCTHPKVLSIDAALASGRAPNLVRAQYRLDPQMFAVHVTHRANAQLTSKLFERPHHLPIQSSHVGGIVGQGMAPTDDPWRQIRFHVQAAARVWRDLEREAREVERLTFLLQEAFRDEDMGL